MRRPDRSPSLVLSQTSVGALKGRNQGLRLPSLSSRPGLISAVLAQHAPGDPGQLVGQSGREHVVVQALGGCREPSPEAVLVPLRGPEKHNASGLPEELPKVAVATLRDAPQNGPIAG